MIAITMRVLVTFLLLGSTLVVAGCRSDTAQSGQAARIFVAQLSPTSAFKMASAEASAARKHAFEALRSAFVQANPGYDLEWRPGVDRIAAGNRARVLFVQGGTAACSLGAKGDQVTSEVALGDLIQLEAGRAFSSAAPLDLLIFTCPEPFPADLQAFVRPDHDPLITDTPGGCAEEDEAYRRILLTWKADVGPYTYHALNAHRVRINDSFTHYHPLQDGFDEFYLVQETRPAARVLTSVQTALIEEPESVGEVDALGLLNSHSLAVGDLIFMPRGTVHRGLGGAVVQVITVPGFVPEREIGVDHHLRRIAERHALDQDQLPFRQASSSSALIK